MTTATARMRHPVRWLHAHPRIADVLLAGLVAALGLAAHFGAHRFHSDDADKIAGPSVFGAFLVLGSSLPLIWRRRFPVVVLCVVTAAQWELELKGAGGPGWLGVLIAAYTLGAHESGRRLWWIAGAFLGAVTVFVLGAATLGDTPWGAVASTLVIIPAVAVFGDSMRLRRKRLADLAERAERAERERELLTRQHVQDERARIARELHDVVAHSVSVMVIQAGAARRQLESNPSRANAALATIESTGRAAMIEMRRILGVLRADDGTSPLAPAPSLALLPELVTVDPDLDVALVIDGSLDDIPSGVEVNVYRLVQEALTNVRRHAGRVDDVTVRIVRDNGRLDVEIVDDGRGASTLAEGAAAGAGAGHGLIGMRERVSSTGGEFSAGPRAGGGWRVHAVLPVPVLDAERTAGSGAGPDVETVDALTAT